MRYLIIFLTSLIGVQPALAQIANFGKNLQNPHNASPPMVKQGHIDPTVRFVANRNQWDKNVLFRAEIPSGFAFLLDDGFHYGLYEGWGNKEKMASNSPHGNTPAIVKAHGVRVKFKNALKNVSQRIKTENEQVTRYNFFLGNDERKWAGNVPAYNQVQYGRLYEGIDLKVFGQYSTMKYEFHVAPQANPDQIKLAYEGADYVRVREKDGFLEIGTSIGTIYEQKPYCYQIIRGEEVQVSAEFRLVGKELTFHFPQGYDKTQKLVIDPVLIFSTYSGSTADNWGSTATFDEAGNLYSGGIVFGAGFPTTSGAFQVSFGGVADMGILKFDPTGKTLIYSTYLGGDNTEFPHSLIVDKNNNLIVFGTTGSGNYPRSGTAFDKTFNGGTNVTPISGITFSSGADMVLTKFNASGSTLLASSYLGGAGNDGIVNTALTTLHNYGDSFRGEVIVDDQDFIYVATTTNSSDFPTMNPAKGSLTGQQDAILLKMKADLSDLVWSTYLGGASADIAYSMKIDAQYNVYVAGGTKSTDLRNMVINTAPTPMLVSLQGNDDGYVAKFDKDGVCLQITYVGTPQADQTFLMDLDFEGNVYVVGQTLGNYPVSASVTYSIPNAGQFIHKISGNLETSLLSTRFGRNKGTSITPDISPTAFLISNCGNVYITGWGSNTGDSAFTLSTTGLPVTPDAFRSNTDGHDFYVTILEAGFKSLLYGTFFGGTSSRDHVDGGTSRFDKRGIIYHAACASCGGAQDFPVTSGAWSTTNKSTNCNNGAFKFDIGSLQVDFNIRDAASNIIIQKACKFPVPTKIAYEGQGATKWTWFIDGVQVSTASSFTYNFPAAGDYWVSLVGENAASCLKADTVKRLFRVSLIELGVMENKIICEGDQTQLQAILINASNPFTFSWSPTTGLSNPNIANPIASPTETTTYTVTAKDDNDCEVQKKVTVEVIKAPPTDVDILNSAGVKVSRGCVPATLQLSYNFALYQITTWVWEVQGFGTFPNQKAVDLILTQAGSYEVKLKVTRLGQCPKDFEIVKNLQVIEFKVDAGVSASICIGENTQLQATPSPVGETPTYVWTPATGLSNPNIANPIASPAVTTTYKVKAVNTDFCESEDEVKVEVTNVPVLDFEIALGSDCAKPTTATFTNKSQHVGTHIWTISLDGIVIITFNDANPAPYNFTKAGKYKIKLKAINGACEAELEKEIDVEDNLSLPPNTITPNNDGKNDTFSIAPERSSYKIEIYNRWGAEMYKSENYKDDWGKNIEAGAYYYILTSPKGVTCRGWVNIIK